MAHVLGIGVATLDIVSVVDAYPAEDSEVRAVAQHVRRGGNAANTLVVLSQLGHRCAFAGALSAAPEAAPVGAGLVRYGVDTTASPCHADRPAPTSCVLVNRAGGSRTIVHYRDLPEYGFAEFAAIDLAGLQWLHFEGRNVDETCRMLERARREIPHVPRSVEVEKPRDGIDRLFADADLLLFSRVYAGHLGFRDPVDFLRAVRGAAPHAALVCAWGAQGAAGIDRAGRESRSPAFPPRRVVDTLGAGDVLNAGIIDGLLSGLDLGEGLRRACRLAGRKCGQWGVEGLPVDGL